MSRSSVTLVIIAVAVSITACGRGSGDTASVDPSPAKTTMVDQASAGPLSDRIIIDPARAGGRRRAGASITDPTGKCSYAYDGAWARRLPAALPPYPGAKLIEAAGSDAPGCKRRITSFTATAAPARIIAFYQAKVKAAGYSAEHIVQHGADVLGGTKGDAAYVITVSPSKTGSIVDLVANVG